MRFAHPSLLWLLLLMIPLIALFAWSWRVRQRLITQFVGARLLENLMAGVSRQRQKVRMLFLLLGVASIVIALARPQLGFSLEESKQSGLDIVVAIDTSKSMLADDVQPNRLQRAKLAALDLMRLARTDRLGLVAFAGGAFLQCPLSLDEEAYRQSVEFLDVNVIPQGGTAVAEAIQTARAAFKEENENHKVLVLFTDGEDNDDAEAAVAAAREGRKAGLRIFTIGVGTPAGEVLSTKDPFGNRVFIKDAQGNVVKSRLNENLLQQLARETDGFYLPLTGARSMDVLYERGLAPLPKSESATRTTRQYHERFQWFIGATILLLLAEMLFPERARQRGSRVEGSKRAALVVIVVLAFGTSQALGAASDALKKYQRGEFGRARAEFERLARKSPQDARLSFNAGAAAFQDGDYETAMKHFSQTLTARDLTLQERSYYNLGNTHFRLGEDSTEPKEKQQQWEQAIQNYESALKLQPGDEDAKFNLEVVKKKLEELKQQQQQQQNKPDQNKDEKNQQEKEQQKKDDKSEPDKEEQKQSEQQKKEEQDKSEQKDQQSEKKDQQSQEQKQQDQQQAQDQRGEQPDKSAEPNYARVLQMTPEQAQQLLDAQKSEERAMIFQPMIQRTNKPKDRLFKDW